MWFEFWCCNQNSLIGTQSTLHTLLWSCFEPSDPRHTSRYQNYEHALDTVYEITKLIKKSPKSEGIFKKVKDDVTTGSLSYVLLTGLSELKSCHQFLRNMKHYSSLGMLQWKLHEIQKFEPGLEEFLHRCV